MSVRTPALVLGALLAFYDASPARAAAVCNDMPGADDWVVCTRSDTTDIAIDLTDPAIATLFNRRGVLGANTGSAVTSGGVAIEITGGSISTTGDVAYGVEGRIDGTLNAGKISIGVDGGLVISTTGRYADGIVGEHYGAGDIDIDFTRGSIETEGSSAYGILGYNDAGGGVVDIDVTGGSIETEGRLGHGVRAEHGGAGGIDVDIAGGSIETTGDSAHGVSTNHSGTGGTDIDMKGGSIETTGAYAYGIQGRIAPHAENASALSIGVNDGAAITTAGAVAHGVYGHHRGAGGIAIDMRGGSIETAGENAYGLFGNHWGAGGVAIDMRGGSIETAGRRGHGLLAYSHVSGTGGVAIDMRGGSVETAGDEASGIYGVIVNAASEGEIAVAVTGGSVAAEGLGARGLVGIHSGLGSVEMTTGAELAVEAPFAIGIEGRATNDANAAGRIVVTHAGAAEAREVGVLAWARRSSGHTMGDGAQTADDAARSEPMIHVTSSGRVTVGASVTDAFIRNRIAGADETLSTGEHSVLDAILAEDSDALDTALGALPAAYDDAWKAAARNLLTKRAAGPTGDAAQAHRAAEEILGLSRAGIRASALSHTGIADYVRYGDRDLAILAIDEADRTAEQVAALAEQAKLSDAERRVLEAVLGGGDPTAALAALPAAYDDMWKDGVRQRAKTYNAGDLRVDVTGGSISAEGNGVEAFYAVPHERNGAITVRVAEGARVTGGANGIRVRGAGAGEGSLRAQSVTVNGAVRGGSGAGVHLAGGGTVTVGATGEVGATSGMGLLADGGGDLTATVSGTVRGDVRVDGGGALRLNVREGGAVTGTVHDPVGLPAVVGRIGRLLYASGATVTVARTGALTGVEVEGKTEALRSAAGDLSLSVAGMGMVSGDVRALGGGDLSATISGTVDGDLQAQGGGELTLHLTKDGAVTGTVHDPMTPLTVVGRIGRLRYTNGATVTVAASGALTGVEIEGRSEALRSAAGGLDLDVAGRVTGDVRALGDGDLAATVSGTVDGDLLGLGAGEHTVTVSRGGTVTGTVHLAASTVTVHGRAGRVRFDNGGRVTVGGTGHVTGVAVDGRSEAIRNAAGELVVSVAEGGRITGDVIDLGTRPARVTTEPGSTLTGSIDVAAAGSAVRVGGTVGRVHFRRGGTVTVGAMGALTGVAVEGRTEAIRAAAGDLKVNVAVGGRIAGDVRAVAGRLTLDLPAEGAVEGTIHNPVALREVRGSIGRLLYTHGGTVTVAGTGRLTGVEVEGRREAIRGAAGDLAVTVAAGGEVGGDVRAEGDGDLAATISGRVAGDVLGLGAGEHTVTVRKGGAVEGTLRFRGGANRVELHEGGRIASREGRQGRAISNEGGTLEVVVRAAGEESAFAALNRVEGRIHHRRGLLEVRFQRAGEEARRVGRFASRTALADGVHDVGLSPVRGREGEFEFKRDYAPRARVYEALPSALLGLNGLRGYRERMAAPRSAKGGWARVESFRGRWKADASTTGKESGVELKYRHRRNGVEVGLAGALGEAAQLGASLHHRRGSMKVTEGGDLELYGTGAGVSGTWMREGVYVDVQGAVTWYEADLASSRRGRLRKDLPGFGHALGVEAGRRMALEHLPAGLVLTPRAGLVHSRVSVDGFTDAVGSRVSVDGARSLRGRAGVDVEAKREGSPGSRVFGSLGVEHEFSTERRVRVSGTELKSEAEATWLRLGLNGVHAWDEGRYTLHGGVGYATSGGSHELGGGLSLSLRF